MAQAVPARILPVIVLSQFAGTSLWFAVNAVLPDLQRAPLLPETALATLTRAVQLGFVTGLRALAGDRIAAIPAAGALMPWQLVILAVSVLAVLGGLATWWLVPDRGPAGGQRISPRALTSIASEPKLRASVFGYFGHMWEL